MKKLLVLSMVAAGVMASSSAMAQRTRTNINLEPTCQNSASGMDPRCIGDTNPNNERGSMRTKRVRSKHVTHHRHTTRRTSVRND